MGRSKNLELIQQAEIAIARAFVEAAIKAGLRVSVDSDGEELLAPSLDVEAIVKNIRQCDEEHLHVYKPDATRPFGWVFLVYGNDGWDVISDYTVNLEHLMVEPNKVSDEWEKRIFGK